MSNHEENLRAIWNAKGVPKEKQDAILASITASAMLGSMVGPFKIGDPDYHIRNRAVPISAETLRELVTATEALILATSHPVPGSADASAARLVAKRQARLALAKVNHE